ncbi:GNAT family N-acetyltransferase [Haladaptatus salinisoli]|uniref:GNAT family N-acetyltransferase n=1 Tax=Haladaptatus salinisoli TaxID=2884876 RepID=UPI001D0B7AEA|nr:GNAT family protein [Haladaptatus salinisoli]
MAESIFPERIETDRLVLERIPSESTDVFELYDLCSTDSWRTDATEHMPWFRFRTLSDAARFVEHAESQWNDRETARYTVRPKSGEDGAGELAGLAAFGPEWDERRAGSGIVLAKRFWGRGYGRERARAMVELTFERFDLDAYYTTVAAGNERSRRMIESYVEAFGGRHEGLLRQYKSRPNGDVTDQHRYSITREEYESATNPR